jgi:hypothetical protein
MVKLEEWKDIQGYEGKYQISSFGRVRNIQKGNFLNPSPNYKGYLRVNLWKNGGYKTKVVHRLVCKAFLDNPDNKPQVNHIDGDKTNNKLQNLEWVTNDENKKHAVKLGLTARMPGTKNGRCKITEDTAKGIIRDLKSGMRNIDIVNKYKVTKDTVSNIKRKKAWNHLQ